MFQVLSLIKTYSLPLFLTAFRERDSDSSDSDTGYPSEKRRRMIGK